MDKNNLFTQEKLDELIGKDRRNPPSSQDPSKVDKHPILTNEKDITNHRSLTNKYEDLSRLGGPAEIPGSNIPQQTEIKSAGQAASQMSQMSTSSNNIPDTTKLPEQNPVPQMDHSQMAEMNSSEVMLLEFFKTLLSSGALSNAFCDQMVKMLCDNVTFMTQLRSQVLERLMNPSNNPM